MNCNRKETRQTKKENLEQNDSNIAMYNFLMGRSRQWHKQTKKRTSQQNDMNCSGAKKAPLKSP